MKCGVFVIGAATWALIAVGAEPEKGRVKTVRELLWVWGNPEMGRPGRHTLETFAQASPAERARLLGVLHVVMAGHGLPDDEAKAREQTQSVAGLQRIVWEIGPDGEGVGPPFVYRDTIGRVRKLERDFPGIKGVLLDDMSTRKIDRGFKPEHVREIRKQLGTGEDRIKLWGVLYTMSMDRERIAEYIEELDVINLWVWHAKDVVHLERYIARCEDSWPGKPIVLGLYLYDYGGGRRMPMDLLELQCETALKLVRAGRIQGIVFLTINNDEVAVGWAADWIRRVGGLSARQYQEK
jgi:hypothetical protein